MAILSADFALMGREFAPGACGRVRLSAFARHVTAQSEMRSRIAMQASGEFDIRHFNLRQPGFHALQAGENAIECRA